jgi:hypothetical protein
MVVVDPACWFRKFCPFMQIFHQDCCCGLPVLMCGSSDVTPLAGTGDRRSVTAFGGFG